MTDSTQIMERLSAEAAGLLYAAVDRQIESAKEKYGISQYAKMWLAGMDMPGSQSSKPSKPYSQVELVFTCVNKLIAGVAALPPVLSTIDDRIVESGPVWDVLFNNPSLSWERFVVDSIGFYVLHGEVFWVFTDMAGTRPKEIRVIGPSQMTPITHDRTAGGELLGWKFRGSGGRRETFSLSEVWQWKAFNPGSRHRGIGPLAAAANSLNYSFASALYNASALANGAEPGLILTAPGKLDPDQVRMLRSQFDARHKGAGQAKRTAVLTGGLEASTVAMKMTDMEVAKITAMSDKKICSTWGVPPGVAGLVTEAQYSHGPAMRDFIFNTIIPLVRLFAGNITAGIISKFYSSESKSVEIKDAAYFGGMRTLPLQRRKAYRHARQKALAGNQRLFLWFDTYQHPVVQEAKEEEAEKVLKYTEAGVPLNQIIEAHDLPYELVPHGDDWWIPMGQVPARFTLEAGLEGLTGPSLPEAEEEPEKAVHEHEEILRASQAQDEAARLRIWRNWVISWAGIEREYSEAMRTLFVRQQTDLLKKLHKALAEDKGQNPESRIQNRASVNEIIARVVFDLHAENGNLKVINHTFFSKAGELGARQAGAEILGLKADALAEFADQVKIKPAVKRSMLISSRKITGVNATTQEMVANQLRTGLDAGEGLKDLTARIKKTLGSNRQRAQAIARTQTAGAVGTGRHEGFKAAGVELKTWLTSRDQNVRDSHRAAESRYAEGVALDVPFQVGGEFLMHPGDPAGSAAQIINCRCVELAKRAAAKIFDLSYYANLAFYSYSDMQKGASSGTGVI